LLTFAAMFVALTVNAQDVKKDCCKEKANASQCVKKVDGVATADCCKQAKVAKVDGKECMKDGKVECCDAKTEATANNGKVKSTPKKIKAKNALKGKKANAKVTKIKKAELAPTVKQ